MALGFLGLEYESRVLPYSDEKTPVDLAGKKMLPILKDNDQSMNESLDIITHIDKDNQLGLQQLLENNSEFTEIENKLNDLGSMIHSLAMPFWVKTHEFDQENETYFRNKKETKRGPFYDLYQKRYELMEQLQKPLQNLVDQINPFYQSKQFGIKDILLASHLWGLYAVGEFQFPQPIHEYLQKVRKLTNFDYHRDFWL
jgi:glutaredoxin 2